MSNRSFGSFVESKATSDIPGCSLMLPTREWKEALSTPLRTKTSLFWEVEVMVAARSLTGVEDAAIPYPLFRYVEGAEAVSRRFSSQKTRVTMTGKSKARQMVDIGAL